MCSPSSIRTCAEFWLTHKTFGGAERELAQGVITFQSDTCNGIVQERQRDIERLEAKDKATDIRALRVSTVRDSWPRLAQAFEAKRAADAAKKAAKAARSAARSAAPDKATASMAARLQAFLQPRTASAPAKVMAGACAAPIQLLGSASIMPSGHGRLSIV